VYNTHIDSNQGAAMTFEIFMHFIAGAVLAFGLPIGIIVFTENR
jgi:hypothetical protein